MFVCFSLPCDGLFLFLCMISVPLFCVLPPFLPAFLLSCWNGSDAEGVLTRTNITMDSFQDLDRSSSTSPEGLTSPLQSPCDGLEHVVPSQDHRSSVVSSSSSLSSGSSPDNVQDSAVSTKDPFLRSKHSFGSPNEAPFSLPPQHGQINSVEIRGEEPAIPRAVESPSLRQVDLLFSFTTPPPYSFILYFFAQYLVPPSAI